MTEQYDRLQFTGQCQSFTIFYAHITPTYSTARIAEKSKYPIMLASEHAPL